LVQNIVGAPSPNRSLWTMAVEVQLYLALPLLLLMVRRLGAAAMVAAVTAVVVAMGIVGPRVPHLDWFVVNSVPSLAALFVVVVYEKIVAPRWGHGAAAFAVTAVLAVPLAIAFARVFAAAFETPFLRRRERPVPIRPRPGEVPA